MSYIVLAVIVLIYLGSFWALKKSSLKMALLMITLAGSVLYWWSASDCYLHDWDEKYHALVAKNLAEYPLHPTLIDDPVIDYNYQVWTHNHTWLHKQPLSLWAMAGFIKVFGTSAFVVRLPSCLCFLICLFLVFIMSQSWFNDNTAYIAAMLFSFNGFIIEIASGRAATDHPDMMFMTMVLLAVFFAWKQIESNKSIFLVLTGLFMGLAVLTKWLPGLIVLPVWWM
ncbi:MAG: glycosyltransferase family 39 protein, partial [Flavobacteriales bacterium]|nr:glycosyltransferase family 39 protein [Flavobacteriales bacterium]